MSKYEESLQPQPGPRTLRLEDLIRIIPPEEFAEMFSALRGHGATDLEGGLLLDWTPELQSKLLVDTPHWAQCLLASRLLPPFRYRLHFPETAAPYRFTNCDFRDMCFDSGSSVVVGSTLFRPAYNGHKAEVHTSRIVEAHLVGVGEVRSSASLWESPHIYRSSYDLRFEAVAVTKGDFTRTKVEGLFRCCTFTGTKFERLSARNELLFNCCKFVRCTFTDIDPEVRFERCTFSQCKTTGQGQLEIVISSPHVQRSPGHTSASSSARKRRRVSAGGNPAERPDPGGALPLRG